MPYIRENLVTEKGYSSLINHHGCFTHSFKGCRKTKKPSPHRAQVFDLYDSNISVKYLSKFSGVYLLVIPEVSEYFRK